METFGTLTDTDESISDAVAELVSNATPAKPSRRSAPAIIVTVQVARTAVPSAAAPTGDIESLITRYRAARATSDTLHAEVIEPRWAAVRKAADAVPHRATRALVDHADGPKALRTDEESTVNMARAVVAKPGKWPADDPRAFAALVELVALADQRDAIVRHELASLDELRAMEEADSDFVNDAIDAVVQHPAATLAELARKTEFIAEVEYWEITTTDEFVAADIRRLAGTA